MLSTAIPEWQYEATKVWQPQPLLGRFLEFVVLVTLKKNSMETFMLRFSSFLPYPMVDIPAVLPPSDALRLHSAPSTGVRQ